VRSALYAVTQVRSIEFGHRSVHRFGKPLLMQVAKQPAFGGRAGVSRSALLLLRFLSLAAGTQSRTDDNAFRPALHEAGSCVSSEIGKLLLIRRLLLRALHHPLALPPRRSPACAALLRRSERVPGCPC
jgi:hypothetical protein